MLAGQAKSSQTVATLLRTPVRKIHVKVSLVNSLQWKNAFDPTSQTKMAKWDSTNIFVISLENTTLIFEILPSPRQDLAN